MFKVRLRPDDAYASAGSTTFGFLNLARVATVVVHNDVYNVEPSLYTFCGFNRVQGVSSVRASNRYRDSGFTRGEAMFEMLEQRQLMLAFSDQ